MFGFTIGVASANVAIFGTIIAGASRPQLYDLRILMPPYSTSAGDDIIAPSQLFYEVDTYSSLVYHWGISFPMAVFTGPSLLYILLNVAFKGLPGGPSQMQIVTVCCIMGVLLLTIYSCQTYLFVSSGTHYFECVDSTYSMFG